MAVYLATASDRLPTSVIYPGTEYGFDLKSHVVRHNKGLMKMVRDRSSGSTKFRDTRTADAMTKLVAHMRTIDTPDVNAIFVQEASSRGGSEIELAHLLTSYFDEVVIVKVARRQDQLMSSQMVQFAKMWKAEPITLDLEQFVSTANFDVDYLDLDRTLSRWESVSSNYPNIRYEFVPFLESDPGTENLHFRFFHVTGLHEMPRDVLTAGVRLNGSLGHDEIVELMRYKSLNARWGWIPGLSKFLRNRHSLAKADSRSDIREKEWNVSPESAPSVWRVDEREATKFLASFRESNRRFLARVPRHGLDDDWNEWASSVGV